MIFIGGFSGGIDSQAAAGIMLERYGKDAVVLVNTTAGDNEHPMTTEHIAWYSANIHPVNVVKAIVSDMWSTPGFAETRGFDGNAPLTFDLMAQIKGRFPSRTAQFCTEKLKLAPIRRWLRTNYPGGDYVRFSGVRADESAARADRQLVEYDDYFDCDLHNPIVDWPKQRAFDFVRDRGEIINPLYSLGFERVGCAPCVNSGKDDILNWANRFPEMIDKVRRWEQERGITFFPPVVPGLAPRSGHQGKMQVFNWIDEVVEWAKTSRGGRQADMFRMYEEPKSCESRFGLCE